MAPTARGDRHGILLELETERGPGTGATDRVDGTVPGRDDTETPIVRVAALRHERGKPPPNPTARRRSHARVTPNSTAKTCSSRTPESEGTPSRISTFTATSRSTAACSERPRLLAGASGRQTARPRRRGMPRPWTAAAGAGLLVDDAGSQASRTRWSQAPIGGRPARPYVRLHGRQPAPGPSARGANGRRRPASPAPRSGCASDGGRNTMQRVNATPRPPGMRRTSVRPLPGEAWRQTARILILG